jgi:hypothetical protein
MDLTTYSGLQAAVATFLVRGDQTLTIPGLIQLCESKLNREVRQRQAEQDANLVGVVGSRYIPLPSAYDEGLNLWYVDTAGRVPVSRFIDPALIQTSTSPGRPYQWTVDGSNIAFERPCDQAYAFTLRMLGKYALSDAVPTNALLSDYPDAYLFGTLAEAGPMLRDPDLTSVYEAKLDAAIKSINAKDARSRAPQTLSTEPGQLQYRGRRSGFDITRGW